ncbi:LysR family transcriptional regulator [Amphritea sp. 1_MG-2023]|uniref:LysR family transcriptional regulator n=1 Tax=Amphritea sp. 1_MG-2023 TaxID=3062670 RepID=UPI0026E34B26|nr:LysR family transcriptional regulator [Amphritea sp. 1_MG-2023]MDO6564267.1 LysR family transcriptional regulator [Amphritea sp. 1_MG-2023]
MAGLDPLEAFVIAAETGSFSAAARRLGKAQSAVSTAISNLELDSNVSLFDRTHRNPVLTQRGQALLEYARTVLHSQHEFRVHAQALGQSDEIELCLAVEQSISSQPLLDILHRFEQRFPHIQLELLDPGGSDVAELIRTNRADIGLMLEREAYPQGFGFRGIGYSEVVAVCRHDHPLVSEQPVSHANFRAHRQLVLRSLDLTDHSHERLMFSPRVWFSESPHLILELLCSGLGWAFLHRNVVQEKLVSGELLMLQRAYQAVASLQGIDVVWSENRSLGTAGSWLLEELSQLDMTTLDKP